MSTDTETDSYDPLSDERRESLEQLRESDDPGLAAFADQLLQSLEGGE